MRKLTLGFVGSVLVAFGIVWIYQWRAGADLRSRIAGLREQSAEGIRLRAESQRLEGLRVSADELERLRKDQRDISALQGELIRLQDLSGLLAKAVDTPRSPPGPPAPMAPGMIALDALTDSGIGTPADAARRFFRAVGQVDPKALATQLAFVGGAGRSASEFYAGMDETTRLAYGSESEMVASYFAAKLGRVVGVELLPDKELGPDTALWTARLQTMNGRVAQLSWRLRRKSDGWHEVVDPPMVMEVMAYMSR